MELTRKAVLRLISFLFMFEGMGNLFYGLVECSKYLAIEQGISWIALILITSVITLSIYVVSVRKVLLNDKHIFMSSGIFIVTFIGLASINQWVGNWLGTLGQENIDQMILAEKVVVYSKHFYLLLNLLALGVILRQAKS